MLKFQTKFSKSLSAIVVAILFASLASSRTRLAGDSAPSGTVIANRAEATYEIDGTPYSTVSETVTFTVQAVATLTVTPKETAPSASVVPQERITRVFRICNTGNVANSYTIVNTDVTAPATLDSLYFDNDASSTLTVGDSLITVGSTSSASVVPGSCLGVLAIADTNAVPFSSLLRIHLTAHSIANGAANGNVEDDGTIINEVGSGPHFSNPSSPALPPLKEINGANQAVVTRGNPFTYTISFRNSGDVAARNLVLSDDLPAGVEYVAGSLHLENNGSNKDLTDDQDADEGFVQGQHIELKLAQLAPDQVVRLSFRAQLTNTAAAAVGLVNVATLLADNAAVTNTNPVVVVADPFGTVFAGRGGASVSVPGATVAVFTEQTLTNLLPLQSALGFTPNAQNANPFASDNQGHFSFGLGPSQIGAASAPVKYFINVKANSYISRLIEINVRPGAAGLLLVTERALDNQPIAVAGGFALVNQEVTIDNLADLAFNIPVFEEHGLEITKSVDQQRAEVGDVVTYHVAPPIEELGEAVQRQALAFSKGLVEGKRIRLEYEADYDRDSAGHTLAYVYLEDGTSLNAEIIKKGYGSATTSYSFHLSREFSRYELNAQNRGLGLWNVTRDSDSEDSTETASTSTSTPTVGPPIPQPTVFAPPFHTYAPATSRAESYSSTTSQQQESVVPYYVPPRTVDQPPVAENGSYYGEISEKTGRPKTVHVDSYTRRDGTYVRGYYRSAPRRH